MIHPSGWIMADNCLHIRGNQSSVLFKVRTNFQTRKSLFNMKIMRWSNIEGVLTRRSFLITIARSRDQTQQTPTRLLWRGGPRLDIDLVKLLIARVKPTLEVMFSDPTDPIYLYKYIQI